MLFHQLGTCEYECFRLAGALVTDANEKAILLKTLAASKYLWTSRLCFHLVVPGARLLGHTSRLRFRLVVPGARLLGRTSRLCFRLVIPGARLG